MPLNRPIIPWVRVSIGLVQFTEQIFKPLLQSGLNIQVIKQSPKPSALSFNITWPDKYFPFMERTGLLHCWGTLGVTNMTSKTIIKPTILVLFPKHLTKNRETHWMTRNISYILTILWNPKQSKCGLAGPDRGLSHLCWLSFLVLFLAPMVHLRFFRFLTSPLHNQTIKQHSKSRTHAHASYPETSFPLLPVSYIHTYIHTWTLFKLDKLEMAH